MEIRIKKLNQKVEIPKYQTLGAAGFDLESVENIVIPPLSRVVVKTGLAIEVPHNFELQIRGRSGMTLKTDIITHFGTVDSDYRGEIGVILINTSSYPFTIKEGDRIAQGVIAPVIHATFIETEDLTATKRDSKGFGSTDK